MPGVIKINPAVFEDERDALAVAWNEALRLVMEDMKFKPEFEVTPEQQDFFADTAYGKDESALKKTIVARIATHDTSVSPTEEQEAETVRLLEMVAEMVGTRHRDYKALVAMRESVATGNARGQVEGGETAGPEEEPEGAPPEGAEGMPPEGMPPEGMPPEGMPPEGMPPEGMPPEGMPPEGMPPEGMPPEGMPPEGAPPGNEMPPEGAGPPGGEMPM